MIAAMWHDEHMLNSAKEGSPCYEEMLSIADVMAMKFFKTTFSDSTFGEIA